jgi:hypothetical protein
MRRLTAIIQWQYQVVFLSDEEPVPRSMQIAYIQELFDRAHLLIPQPLLLPGIPGRRRGEKIRRTDYRLWKNISGFL